MTLLHWKRTSAPTTSFISIGGGLLHTHVPKIATLLQIVLGLKPGALTCILAQLMRCNIDAMTKSVVIQIKPSRDF